MEVLLYKADLKDAVTIHEMKVKAFMPLLEKYQDFETSPANESVERIIAQINKSFTDYFIIHHLEVAIGGISPIFILPEHQGKGIAQKVFEYFMESIYSWRLIMSVSVFRINQEDDSFELGFEIPVSNERFFMNYWQSAIEQLGISCIRNGTELRKEQLELTLQELEKLRIWAQSKLLKNETEYMLNRIDWLLIQLPFAFITDDTVLWIG
ncbi:GNAT family N-acetyltransferase [Cohnella sp. GCM10012308]|uniref:GNAT family N-acetyltransferase n=1 Tax=Cohnella sp. GCM10012308 TaxID=3317329 RepID=UPI003619AADC